MKLGFSLPTAGAWATPENQVRIARRAEAFGYHSLWVFQRLLYPVAPQNRLPADARPAVAASPSSASRIPVVDARLRGGRDLADQARHERAHHAVLHARPRSPSSSRRSTSSRAAGSTSGWASAGRGTSTRRWACPIENRGRRADEFLACLKAIWTEEPVEFRGEFYRVPRKSRIRPKPLQKPHPPHHHRRLRGRRRRAARGHPRRRLQRRQRAADRVAPSVRELKAAAAAAGKDPSGLHIVCRGSFRLFDPAARQGAAAALGHARGDPRGRSALRRRGAYRALPRRQLRSRRRHRRAGAGSHGSPGAGPALAEEATQEHRRDSRLAQESEDHAAMPIDPRRAADWTASELEARMRQSMSTSGQWVGTCRSQPDPSGHARCRIECVLFVRFPRFS